ncbi:MAG: AfsR/SARP family transcriptional regulator, partial [Micromonosporaceae bacterium]
MPQPRVLILGPVEVWVGDRQVHLNRLERSLVAVLALARGRVVATDRLAVALWPGRPSEPARGRLRSLVSSVRRALIAAGDTDGVLRSRPPGYLLRLTAEQFDLSQCEAAVAQARTHEAEGRPGEAADALRAALRLWRGQALDGVAVSAADAAQLDELRLRIFSEYVDAERDRGAGTRLIPEVRHAVEEHPTQQHLRCQLMLLLDGAGRTAEALRVYRDGCRALRDHGVNPGPELRRLWQRIQARRPGVGPTPASDPPPRDLPEWQPPHQLPPEGYPLVGRGPDVAALRQLVDRHHDSTASMPALVAWSGMGGVGKTALALAVAHAIRRDHPDGCLFADLRGHEAAHADPYHLMGSFLRALGSPPQAVPDDPETRLAAYRSRTADRTLLIVLDNAADERQVRPLIPASGTATVLVTGRTALLGLDGAQLKRLDVLPLPAAVDLLRTLLGPDRVAGEPEAADRLVRLCGRLPLALRITAARLISRTEMSLRDAVDRLTDEQRRLTALEVGDVGVRSSLQLSYQRLDPSAATLIRRLGLVAGGDVPGWLPEVLLGDGADAALDRLVDAHLLDVGHCHWTKEVRYHTHDLVRLFCHERAVAEDSSEVRTAALHRTYLVLLRVAHLANALLPVHAYPSAGRALPSPAVPTAERAARRNPVGWFEAELPRLLDAVDDAVTHGWLDIAWRLVASLTNYLELTSRLEEGLRLHRVVLRAMTAKARARDEPMDQAAEAAMLLGLARFLRVSERNTEAIRSVRRARLLFRNLGDRHGQASAAISLGVAARSLGRAR